MLAKSLALSLLLLTVVVGCGGGGGKGGSSPSVDTPASLTRVEGSLQVPGSVVHPNQLTVSTSLGSSSPSQTGNFSVQVNSDVAQVVTATDAQNNVVLLGLSGSSNTRADGGIGLSARSTAVVMVLLHPFLANSDKAASAQLVSIVEGLPETTALEQAIASQISQHGRLDFTDQEMEDAYSQAVNATVEVVKSGSGNATTRSVEPGEERSGILIISGDDRDPSNIQLQIDNFKRRWLQIWATPVDGNGNPVEQSSQIAWTGPPSDVSASGFIVSGIFTGQVIGPSELSLSVKVPANAVATRLEFWGPGLQSSGEPISRSEFLSRAKYAVGATAFTEGVMPVLEMMSGVKIPEGSNKVLKFVQELISAKPVMEEYISALNADSLSAQAQALCRLSLETVQFVLTDDEMLQTLVEEFGISAVAKTQLKYASQYIKLLGLAEKITQGGWTVYSLATSKPREDYLVSAGNASSSLRFRVTLSWNEANDIDLHTFGPNGQHSWYSPDSMTIAAGELDVDDTDGFGPENFTARSLVPGTYRIAVNYFNGSQATQAKVRLRTANGTVRDFGPYSLTQDNSNEGYPVTGNTSSWWRPCDIVVGQDGSVQVVNPDTSYALSDSQTRSLSRKAKR